MALYNYNKIRNSTLDYNIFPQTQEVKPVVFRVEQFLMSGIRMIIRWAMLLQSHL